MKSASVAQIEVVVMFTAFIAVSYGFGIYLFPAMVESIRADIHFSYGTMGLISGSVLAGSFTSSALAGFLTLRFGAIKLIRFSIIACAASLAGLVFTNSVLVLAGFLLVLGACASLIWVPMVEVSRDIIAPKNRGKALGLMSSGTSYGVFVNSALLAMVLPTYGWRATWAVTAFLVGLLAVYGMIRLTQLRNNHHSKQATLQKAEPGIRARAMSLPRSLVGVILAMMFFSGLSCFSFQTYLSAYLIGEVGFEETRVASVWGLIGLVGMFSGFLMGALADRITIRRGLTVAYLVLALASFATIFINTTVAGLMLVYVAAIAFGLSFYAIYGLVPAYISHLFGEGNAALVFAFSNVASAIGGIVGNLIGGNIKEFTGSFEVMYIQILATAIVSAVIAAALPSEVRHNLSQSSPAD